MRAVWLHDHLSRGCLAVVAAPRGTIARLLAPAGGAQAWPARPSRASHRLLMCGSTPMAGACPVRSQGSKLVSCHAASSSWSWFSAQDASKSHSPLSSTSSCASSRLAQELSWQPGLSTAQDFQVLAASALCCALVYYFTGPARLSMSYAAGMAMLYGWLIWLLRSFLIERQYQAKACAFSDLGDTDSVFAQLGGIHVHAKASVSTRLRDRLTAQLHQALLLPSGAGAAQSGGSKLSGASPQQHTATATAAAGADGRVLDMVAAHCYHGFGANLYSYMPVQARLADALQAVVTSHDMPGFGLTERPKSTDSYFLTFNGQLGGQVMQYEVHRTLSAALQAATSSSPGADVGAARCAASWQQASALRAHPLPDMPGWEALEEEGVDQGRGVSHQGLLRASSPVSILQASEHQAGASSILSRNASSMGGIPVEQPTTPSSTCSSVFSADNPHQQQLLQQAGLAARVQKVLIGHSMGSICAALEALHEPAQVAALVLVAPAIVALPDNQAPLYKLRPLDATPDVAHNSSHNVFAADKLDRLCCDINHGACEGSPDAGMEGSGPARPASLVGAGGCVHLWERLAKVVKAVAQAVLLLMTLAVLTVMRPVIIVLLRVLVRSRNFWLKGLQQAYYDPALVTDQVVDAYRLPQLVRGWEAGMFMFLTARLVHTTDWRGLGSQLLAANMWASSPSAGVEQQMAAEELGLAHRLALLSRKHGTPVLIIHGVHDKLVPASNSRRLAAMLPGCELALLRQCGHMPQEELPHLFVALVQDFVQRRGSRPHIGQLMPLTEPEAASAAAGCYSKAAGMQQS